jgi:hypothetical protein
MSYAGITMDMFMQNMLVLDGYIEWAIWVPKVLLTNKRGPIKKWVPKNKS